MLPKRVLFTNLRSLLAVKYSTQAEAANKKETYYKNLALDQHDDIKPAGWDEARPFDSMPGPKRLPLIGNVWRFLPGGEFHNVQFNQLITSFPKKFGNIVRFGGIPGRKEFVFIYDPDDMEYVLRNTGPFPVRDVMDSLNYYRNVLKKDIFKGMTGLATMHGEDWYKMRTVVNPILMQPRTIQQYTIKMDQIAKDLVNFIRRHIKEKGENETGEHFADDLYKWALESVAAVALNKRLGALNPDLDENSEVYQFMKAVLKLFDQLYVLEILPPYWKYLPSKQFNEFVKNMDLMVNISRKYFDEGLQNVDETIPDNELSVLQQLAKVDKNIAFTMILDMLQAGIDTTGKTLGTILYFMAKNIDKQNKLREELVSLLPEKDSIITPEILAKTPYLKAVIKESTRKSPIGVGNVRTTTKRMVVGGYQIPKGVDLLLAHMYISNQIDTYVKNPDAFMPERWLRSTTDEYSYKNIHAFAIMPFGFGPRSCIGKRLANLELEVGLANIIRNYELSWNQPDMRFGAKLLYGFLDPLKLTVKEVDK